MKTFDDFDLLACDVMTIVALEGQTMAVQRKIASLLRNSASPSIISPGTPLPQDGASAPSRLPETGRGNELERERV